MHIRMQLEYRPSFSFGHFWRQNPWWEQNLMLPQRLMTNGLSQASFGLWMLSKRERRKQLPSNGSEIQLKNYRRGSITSGKWWDRNEAESATAAHCGSLQFWKFALSRAEIAARYFGLFDKMSSFYGQLDLYKHLSTVDRKTLFILNGGGSWTRNFKSYSANVEKTAFSVTGFIQPTFVYEMLNLVPDADSLHNRQLLDFPPVQTASAIIHHFNHHKFIIVGLSNGESLFQATLSASFSVWVGKPAMGPSHLLRLAKNTFVRRLARATYVLKQEAESMEFGTIKEITPPNWWRRNNNIVCLVHMCVTG